MEKDRIGKVEKMHLLKHEIEQAVLAKDLNALKLIEWM